MEQARQLGYSFELLYPRSRHRSKRQSKGYGKAPSSHGLTSMLQFPVLLPPDSRAAPAFLFGGGGAER